MSLASITKLWHTLSRSSVRTLPMCLDSCKAIKEPHILFLNWLEDAIRHLPQQQPQMVCLATVNGSGHPIARLTRIEHASADGLRFYTSYSSRKACEIAANPHVAVIFFWPHINRCVSIEGTAKRTTREESVAQFRRFSRDIQLHICSSQPGFLVREPTQTEKILNFVLKYLRAEEQVSMPANWGGFHIRPSSYEFSEINKNSALGCLLFRRADSIKDIANSQVNQGENGWVYEHVVATNA